MRQTSPNPLNRIRRALVAAALAPSVLATPFAAAADEYDDEKSGHPLRVIAYVVHPVGLLIDTLIFRPAHWIGSHEPFSTLFGHEDE